MGAFPDQIALELGQGPKDMKDELAPEGGRIDLLGETLEPDPPLRQLGYHFDQVLEGSAQAIKAPDDEGDALPQIADGLVQDGPGRLRSTRRFSVDLAAAGLRERIELQIKGLFPGRDPGIAKRGSCLS
jgi:hypothetical protein